MTEDGWILCLQVHPTVMVVVLVFSLNTTPKKVTSSEIAIFGEQVGCPFSDMGYISCFRDSPSSPQGAQDELEVDTASWPLRVGSRSDLTKRCQHEKWIVLFVSSKWVFLRFSEYDM